MKKTYRKILVVLNIFVSFYYMSVVRAAKISDSVNEKIKPFENEGLVSGNVQTVAGTIIKTALGIVGSLALVMFIYGAFQWMTAGGESKKIDSAKKTFVWSVIGLLLVFFSYAILTFIIKAL